MQDRLSLQQETEKLSWRLGSSSTVRSLEPAQTLGLRLGQSTCGTTCGCQAAFNHESPDRGKIGSGRAGGWMVLWAGV